MKIETTPEELEAVLKVFTQWQSTKVQAQTVIWEKVSLFAEGILLSLAKTLSENESRKQPQKGEK